MVQLLVAFGENREIDSNFKLTFKAAKVVKYLSYSVVMLMVFVAGISIVRGGILPTYAPDTARRNDNTISCSQMPMLPHDKLPVCCMLHPLAVLVRYFNSNITMRVNGNLQNCAIETNLIKSVV